MNKQTEKALKDLEKMAEELNNNILFSGKRAEFWDNELYIEKDTRENGIKGSYKTFIVINYSRVFKGYTICFFQEKEKCIFIDKMSYRECIKIAINAM